MKLEIYKMKRETVRKEISKLMRSKVYYENDTLWKRVSALTGLETYLTFIIEELEEELEQTAREYDSYVD